MRKPIQHIQRLTIPVIVGCFASKSCHILSCFHLAEPSQTQPTSAWQNSRVQVKEGGQECAFIQFSHVIPTYCSLHSREWLLGELGARLDTHWLQTDPTFVSYTGFIIWKEQAVKVSKPITQIPVCLHSYNYQSHIQKLLGEFTAWRPPSGEFVQSQSDDDVRMHS